MEHLNFLSLQIIETFLPDSEKANLHFLEELRSILETKKGEKDLLNWLKEDPETFHLCFYELETRLLNRSQREKAFL
jgi:hypothetical protein